MKHYDYVIVGSGIAGLYMALIAREASSVLILTKGSIEECNTRFAQGGIAAAIGATDSAELHTSDTLKAGADLCDPEAVRILTTEAANRIADLIRMGVPFDTHDGSLALTTEAAHTRARILHAGGDATGMHIELSLSRLARLSNVTIREYTIATDILLEKGKVKGVVCLDTRRNMPEEVSCKHLILATGSSGRLFKHTTNPDVATGDGVAIAYDAGAIITDMEFFQFHPTALSIPGVPAFLISEAVRGEGGILRNASGKAFMADYTPQKELAPRDVVSRSVMSEMNKTKADHVYLDVTHLKANVAMRFPQIYRFCLEQGLDISKQLIPVAPAAHYQMGGIRVNLWGETNVQGLYACGEVACTGVHGANRLASNSLLETVVFGKRLIDHTLGKNGARARPERVETIPLLDRKPRKTSAQPSLSALQTLMWNNVGIVRNEKGLTDAANTLAYWQSHLGIASDRPSHELRNLVIVGRLVAEAALIRKESRGAHYRTDYPQVSEAWQKHIYFKKSNDER